MKNVHVFSAWFYKKTGWKTAFAASAVFILFMVFVLPNAAQSSKEATGTGESPDGSYLYSAQTLYEIAESYGEKGRDYYIKARFTFDVIWPLVYLFFLASLITFFLQGLKPQLLKLANLLPFGGAAFDFLENISASAVMARYPAKTPVAAELTPVFSFIKWSLIYASFGVVFLGLIIWVYEKIRKKPDA
ncbi:hypothetical protein WKH31_01060 [Metabacillus indicus]|uniref:hypothetical protein n=1 Tax=Metabacillus indicus TaxID=246786 RepID=UPI003182222A